MNAPTELGFCFKCAPMLAGGYSAHELGLTSSEGAAVMSGAYAGCTFGELAADFDEHDEDAYPARPQTCDNCGFTSIGFPLFTVTYTPAG